MKRFQECNIIVKIFRLRWYLLIPFKFIFYSYFKLFKVYRDEFIDGKYIHTNKYDVITGKRLWQILIGDAQCKMYWVYDFDVLDDLFDKIKTKYKKH